MYIIQYSKNLKHHIEEIFNDIEKRRKTNKKMIKTNSLRVREIQDCIIGKPTWKSGRLHAVTNEKVMGQLEAEAEEAVTGAGQGRVHKITKRVCNEFRENTGGGGRGANT